MVYSIIQLQPDSAGDIRLAHFSVFQLLVLVLLFVLSSFSHTALISVFRHQDRQWKSFYFQNKVLMNSL